MTLTDKEKTKEVFDMIEKMIEDVEGDYEQGFLVHLKRQRFQRTINNYKIIYVFHDFFHENL